MLFALVGGMGINLCAAAPTAEQIIARARVYLGNETELTAIKSVHYIGTMEARQISPENQKTPLSFAIEIIFEKPYRQRIIRTSPTVIEVTGLDDYDGWRKVQDVTNPKSWQLTLLDPDVTKKLRANTWENLNFFKGIEQRGGRTKVIGPATVDGQAATEVAFIHEPGIVFYRYFDNATGKLLLTETGQGGRIKEEGEIKVAGLRFPQKVITTSTTVEHNGKTVKTQVTITFTKILLNETFPNSYFAVPVLDLPSLPEAESAAPVAAP